MTLATLHEQLGAFLALGVPGDSQVGRWDLDGPVPVWRQISVVVEGELDGVPTVEIG